MEKENKDDELEKLVTLSVRIPVYQKRYLQQFAELSDIKVPHIIRELIDFFIETK